jgi:hypothetical protein
VKAIPSCDRAAARPKRAPGARLLPILWLALSGCALGPTVERETIWAKHGTPGRIVDQREVEVLVPVEGRWVRSRAVLAGLVVLDEPTLEYYRSLDARRSEGESHAAD